MLRSAMAMVMLFLTAACAMSQGLAVVLCECSGHVFMGAAPEHCCGECPTTGAAVEAPAALAVMHAPQHANCILAGGECLTVVAKGWETYVPMQGVEKAPAPALAAPVVFLEIDVPALCEAPVWIAFRHPEPSAPPQGRDRALMYGSLQI